MNRGPHSLFYLAGVALIIVISLIVLANHHII